MVDYEQIFAGKLPQVGDFPACFAFSVHKAGSSLMFGMIQKAARYEGIPALSIPDTLFKAGILDAEWQADKQLLPYFSAGRIYLGFRYFPELLASSADTYQSSRSVLLVRDPRDALVSQYFSFQGSHVLPEKNQEVYLETFKTTALSEIDEYVIKSVPAYKKKLLNYHALVKSDNVRVFRYEDIIFKKEEFLKDIFAHFSLPVSDVSIAKTVETFDVRPEAEDVKAHIRKVTPGDHREKLQPSTIEILDNEFGKICEPYGYHLV